ncbi:MAG: integration host factor subunit alpha [Desulfobacteraceae bacterium]|jgi:integration host factor subunit alpha
MTCTKKDLVDSICLKYGFTAMRSSNIVECFFNHIKDALVTGEDVLISGFGKFYLIDKKIRKGRNPATGEDLMLDARRIISFKSSGKLKKKLNE